MTKRILIHASLDHVKAMREAAEALAAAGLTAMLPDLQRYQHIRDVEKRPEAFNRIKTRLSRESAAMVEQCDALYIVNPPHRHVENYIGGQSFFEMALAFYLGKPIFLANPVPTAMPYTEEILAFNPVIVGSGEKAARVMSDQLNGCAASS